MNRAVGIGLLLGVTAGSVLVYQCLHDDELKSSIMKSATAVRDLARTLGDYRARRQETLQKEEERQTERNQAWADQQWEALGI